MSDELIKRFSRKELIEWRKILRQEIAASMNKQRGNMLTLRKIQSELDRRKR